MTRHGALIVMVANAQGNACAWGFCRVGGVTRSIHEENSTTWPSRSFPGRKEFLDYPQIKKTLKMKYASAENFLVANQRNSYRVEHGASNTNVNGWLCTSEMEQVMRLWEEHARPILVFNGNLDGIRASFAPFGNGKKLKQTFVPQFETAFYVHKFAAGAKPGLLYRAYPGPWRVFRAVEGGGMECVAEYVERPEMRDVVGRWRRTF